MNRGKQKEVPVSGGYTIVEVMIFLAVTAVLFAVAMGLISGQQNRTQFTTGVRDFESQINDIANNVATGYYASSGTFTCSIDGAGKVQISSTDTAQGTNDKCIFAGTVLKFGAGTGADNEATVLELPMAGRRLVSGVEVKSLAEAQPVPIYDTSVTDVGSTFKLGYGARVVCVRINDADCSGGTNAGSGVNAAIGFFTTFNGSDPAANKSGIQTDLIYFPWIAFNNDKATTVNLLKIPSLTYSTSQLATLRPQKLTICVRSGGTNQYALLTIGGGSSSNLTVTSEIKQISGGNICT